MKKRVAFLMVVVFFMVFFPIVSETSVRSETIGDVNGDGKIGLVEAIYALQVSSGMIVRPSDDQVKGVEDVLNYTAMAMADSRNFMAGTEMMASLLDRTCLGDAFSAGNLDDAYNTLFECDFSACGEFTHNIKTDGIELNYIFQHPETCDGISGSLNIVAHFDSGSQQIVLVTTFDNLAGSGCTINGSATFTGTMNGNDLTLHVEADDLNMCGSTLNGLLEDLTYDPEISQIVSADVNGTFTYYDTEEDVSVKVVLTNVTYTPASGINGSATVTFDTNPPGTHTVTLSGIVPDPQCGIPVQGTMIIDGKITVDFSETTCENPTVVVMVGNFPVRMSLEDVLHYIENL